MDSLSLLLRAWMAGLDVEARGDRLVVRGRRSQEPLARELLDHKSEVLAELEGMDEGPWPQETCPLTADVFSIRTLNDLEQLGSGEAPPGACYACGRAAWWRLKSGSGDWICTRCHPPQPRRPEIETWQAEEGAP